MSLLLHYPLNVDGTNQGFKSGSTFSGTFVEGKLGNCLFANNTSFDSGLSYSTDCNYMNTSVTMAAWVKINKSELDARYETLKTSSSAWSSSYTTIEGSLLGLNSYNGLAIQYKTNTLYNATDGTFNTLDTLRFFGCLRGKNSSNANVTASTNGFYIPFDIWLHVALVFDRELMLMKLYIDGEFKYQTAIPTTLATVHQNFRINTPACWSGNAITTSLPIYYNDVRLYDEALSEKEVKDLARGCIGWWNFEQPEIDTNVNICNWKDTSTISSTGWSGSKSYSDNILTLTSTNGWYAHMWDIGADNVGKSVTFSFEYYTSETYDSAFAYVQNHTSVGYGSELKRLSMTQSVWKKEEFVISSANQYIGFNLRGVDSKGLTMTLKFRNIKISFSDHPSEYTEYNELGRTVFDLSGMNNHLTTTGSITCIDGCKGNSAIHFSDDCAIKAYRPAFTFLKQQFTAMVWCRISATSSNGNYILSQGRDSTASGFNITAATNGTSINCLLTTKPSTSITSGSLTAKTTEVGKWYHIAMTYDGENLKAYGNGVLSGTKALTGDIDYTYGPAFVLGKMAYNYTSDTTYFPFLGDVAEVKMFATALSAEEIKREYENATTIDNKGSVFTGLINESDELTEFSVKEDFSLNTFMANELINYNGSLFMRVMHHNNKAGTNLFSKSDAFASSFVYHNDDCWSAFHLIPNQIYDGVYEFLAIQQTNNDVSDYTYVHWTQTNNPVTSTTAGTVTVITGDSTKSPGLMLTNQNYTFMARHTSSNWWSACGSFTKHGIGIPAFENTAIDGSLDLYVRVKDFKFKTLNNGSIYINKLQLK